MKCPIDHVELVMSERHGVEIDYCPKCRGVWLDRGELDKIIERAVPPVELAEPKTTAPQPREYREPYHDDEQPRVWREPYRENQRGKPYSKKKRRKSFLEEIFDFD